jgi:isopentenyl-diphosphate Delta-isomerase
MVAPRKTPATLTTLDHPALHGLRARAHAPINDIEQRKKDHLDIILSGAARHSLQTGFDDLHFEHCALPDIDLAAIDLSTEFLGKRLKLPFLASSMTGGPEKGGSINMAIAEAAQELGFAMGVGSQRIALGGGKASGLDKSIRRVAPRIPLYANLGAVQFTHGMTVDDARRAVDEIEADALILHLNPLQEALQSGGDRNWSGVEKAMTGVCRFTNVPVIAKEVGAGISVSVAKRLVQCGVSAIDVAGVGGSSWAAVEGRRASAVRDQDLAEIFRDWGIPTVEALASIRAALPAMPLIASGGIRHGLDGAKAIRLGATLVGQAAALLKAATEGPAAVIDHVTQWSKALRIASFVTNSANLSELQATSWRRSHIKNE